MLPLSSKAWSKRVCPREVLQSRRLSATLWFLTTSLALSTVRPGQSSISYSRGLVLVLQTLELQKVFLFDLICCLVISTSCILPLSDIFSASSATCACEHSLIVIPKSSLFLSRFAKLSVGLPMMDTLRSCNYVGMACHNLPSSVDLSCRAQQDISDVCCLVW